jgi:hypothetical protein
MVKTGAGSPKSGWTWRDWIAAAALFVATAAVVLWQNAHVAVLWDLSYVLDSAARIAQGQVPYRDFPFAHAPLTFLIQAAIIRLTGRVFFHHVLYAAVVGGLSTVLTWRIVLHSLQERLASAWAVALLLAAPLTVLGIYCILPLPSYDCDCGFSILVAVWLLQRIGAEDEDTSGPCATRELARGFIAGVAVCSCSGPAVCWTRSPQQDVNGEPRSAGFARRSRWRCCNTSRSRTTAALHRGAWQLRSLDHPVCCAAPSAGFCGYARHLPRSQPTVDAALRRCRPARIAALVLLAAPFLFALYALFLYDDADERGDSLLALWPLLLVLSAALALFNLVRLRRHLNLGLLLPVVLLVAINGTLMSQQLWGSTYAIWPLLILLIAEMIAFLAALKPPVPASGAAKQSLAQVMAAVISATLLVCGGFYTASEERLSYAQLPEGPVEHSTFPQLAGIAVPGPYLPNFEELLRFADANIPANDGVLLLPGEDPFYFVTGRTPQFPVLLFDPATDPFLPTKVVDEARQHQTRWLIVKRELQMKEDPTPQREATLKLLLQEFTLSAHLHGYDVYRRR